MEYDNEQDYLFAREIFKESKYVYDDLIRNLKVNKLCKEGLINNVNLNCIQTMSLLIYFYAFINIINDVSFRFFEL